MSEARSTRATASRPTRWGSGLVALGLGVSAVVGMQRAVSSQFHDDGIYLATAESIATGQGYRHASLPTTPAQTKYPPLYSLVLAGVWRIAPESPANIPWLKGTSVASLILVVLLAAVLGRQVLGPGLGPPLLALLVGASPLVFPFTDYALTELPFLALCLAALVLAPGRDGDASSGRAIGLGVVCGLALLVRQAALPLVGAGVLCFALRRRWRSLALFVATAAAFLAPWLAFKAAHGAAVSNPLLAYYTAYEPSVVELALGDPALGLQILLANVYYLWTALDLALYLTYVPAARILVYPVLLIGLWRLFRRPQAFLPAFAILYTLLVLLWPWHPARYAIPLAPILPLAVLVGTRALARRLAPESSRSTGERRARAALPWLPALLLVLMAGGWLSTFVRQVPGTTRMAFLARLPYDWRGFEETAAWIGANTAPDAVLATAYDPLYYLRTGRRGVRPWLHRPWTYFYPVGDPTPDLGTAEEIQPALEELGVTHLLVDPLDGYLEAEAAFELFRDLLASYDAPRYSDPPRLVFVSSDSLHRVYELPRTRVDETGGAGPP